MNAGYIAAILFMLACGWRAWSLLANVQPWVRSAGTVLSTLAPLPVFLIVVLQHYAARRSKRPDAVVAQ